MHNEKKNIQPIAPEAFGKSTQNELAGLFYDYALPGLVVEGKMWAMPIEWNALSLYYNVKWFQKAGIAKPPTDWDELTQVALKLNEKDSAGNVTKPGFQLTYSQTEWPLKRLNPMIVGLGGSILNPEGTECKLNSPEAIEAIQMLTDWTFKHKVSVKGYTVPNLNNSQSLMAGGYYPMQTTGPYFAAALKQANANFKYGEDWNVVDHPQWPAAKMKKKVTALWRWALFLSAPSKNALDMSKFFSFVLKDWKGVHTEVGFIPSLKGWENEAYTKELPWLPQQMKDLQVAVPVPQTPRYPEIAQQNLEMLERIESGQQKVADSANEATKKINDILKQKP
jgi:multiple sugar transport system substrate-binding protein